MTDSTEELAPADAIEKFIDDLEAEGKSEGTIRAYSSIPNTSSRSATSKTSTTSPTSTESTFGLGSTGDAVAATTSTAMNASAQKR